MMTGPRPNATLLPDGLAIATLSGCDRIEQFAAEAVAQARQSAAALIDAAVRTGSLQQAAQKARQARQDAKQKTAVMPGEANAYVAAEASTAPPEQPPTEAL